jgi:hypothetical protein
VGFRVTADLVPDFLWSLLEQRAVEPGGLTTGLPNKALQRTSLSVAAARLPLALAAERRYGWAGGNREA